MRYTGAMTVLALPQIVSTPDTIHGAPRIDGHHIRVSDIAVMCVREGRSVEDVAEAYLLSKAQVHAALAYYWDHRDEIESDIEADNRAVDEFRRKYPSKLPRHLNDR